MNCHIAGCKYLQTSCVTCGRLVCTSILPKPNGWINIKNDKPKVDDKVIALIDGCRAILEFLGDDQWCDLYFLDHSPESWFIYKEDDYTNYLQKNLTHWMPIPPPPRG